MADNGKLHLHEPLQQTVSNDTILASTYLSNFSHFIHKKNTSKIKSFSLYNYETTRVMQEQLSKKDTCKKN